MIKTITSFWGDVSEIEVVYDSIMTHQGKTLCILEAVKPKGIQEKESSVTSRSASGFLLEELAIIQLMLQLLQAPNINKFSEHT